MELKELDKKKIGERIRLRREALGMTREELGDCLDVTAKFLYDVEYGIKGLSLRNFYNIRQILGVSGDFLLDGGTEESHIDEKKKVLSENIMGSLSVCSVKQLGVMEQMTKLYVESIVNREE